MSNQSPRRSVTLSIPVHALATKAAADAGMTCTDWVSRLIRAAVKPAPPVPKPPPNAYCAICGRRPADRMDVIDEDKPPYPVCPKCAMEVPTATYGTRGYEPSGGLPGRGDIRGGR